MLLRGGKVSGELKRAKGNKSKDLRINTMLKYRIETADIRISAT